MKLLIASDIHGSYEQLAKIIQIFERWHGDKLILLGDIFHGGLANFAQISKGARDMGHLLSTVCTKLILVRGNCDRDEDEAFSPVGFHNQYEISFQNTTIYFAHGHRWFTPFHPKVGELYCTGHTHQGSIIERGGVIYCNPGSVTLPRGQSVASFLWMDEHYLTLYDLEQNILEQYTFS